MESTPSSIVEIEKKSQFLKSSNPQDREPEAIAKISVKKF